MLDDTKGGLPSDRGVFLDSVDVEVRKSPHIAGLARTEEVDVVDVFLLLSKRLLEPLEAEYAWKGHVVTIQFLKAGIFNGQLIDGLTKLVGLKLLADPAYRVVRQCSLVDIEILSDRQLAGFDVIEEIFLVEEPHALRFEVEGVHVGVVEVETVTKSTISNGKLGIVDASPIDGADVFSRRIVRHLPHDLFVGVVAGLVLAQVGRDVVVMACVNVVPKLVLVTHSNVVDELVFGLLAIPNTTTLPTRHMVVVVRIIL